MSAGSAALLLSQGQQRLAVAAILQQNQLGSPGPCFCSKRVAFAAVRLQQSASLVVLAFARLQQRLSRTGQCLDGLPQRTLLQPCHATAAGSLAVDHPAVWPLHPGWSCCLVPHLCWTPPAEPGMPTGPHPCTPPSSQRCVHSRLVEHAASCLLGNIYCSASVGTGYRALYQANTDAVPSCSRPPQTDLEP